MIEWQDPEHLNYQFPSFMLLLLNCVARCLLSSRIASYQDIDGDDLIVIIASIPGWKNDELVA